MFLAPVGEKFTIRSLASKVRAGAIGGGFPVTLTSVKELKFGTSPVSVKTNPSKAAPVQPVPVLVLVKFILLRASSFKVQK